MVSELKTKWYLVITTSHCEAQCTTYYRLWWQASATCTTLATFVNKYGCRYHHLEPFFCHHAKSRMLCRIFVVEHNISWLPLSHKKYPAHLKHNYILSPSIGILLPFDFFFLELWVVKSREKIEGTQMREENRKWERRTENETSQNVYFMVAATLHPSARFPSKSPCPRWWVRKRTIL